ncbi:MAG: hypothetical protein ACI38U_15160 [Corynebacterium sp.]|uniref:hypothetical protein n=1 Tax=unclassified Corynebacterium TaxID=2624378 RepID=UPI00095A3FC1|nr:hypothetical protein [Corynebacterium sp. CNJ-954]OLT53697.1 hypothetical protein BJF89_02450 [Corynebacterium sp. CNJ-954]
MTVRLKSLRTLSTWPARRWFTAVATAVATVLVTAVPTAMIPTPYFTRDVPTTAWAWPVLLVTSLLVGMVTATYVARKDAIQSKDRSSRLGALGAATTFFAVGCPVCNKLVLLALGYTGAMQYFAPVQPALAVLAVLVLVWALVTRVRREDSCPVTPAVALAGASPGGRG